MARSSGRASTPTAAMAGGGAVEEFGVTSPERGEFAQHWKVLLATVVGNAFSVGILLVYTFGIFGPALAEEFGWTRSAATSGYLVAAVVGSLFAPVAGLLADRLGARRVALGSSLLLGPAFMSLALLSGSVLQYLLTWALIAFVGAGTLQMVWLRAINTRFDRHKGLAFGISLTGSGLAAAFLKPFAFWLLDHWGWRGGYIGLGLLPLISFVIAWFLFDDSGRDETAHGRSVPIVGPTFGEALRAQTFWLLLAGVFLGAMGIGGANPNIESILREQGLGRAQIMAVVPITGLAAIAGRLLSSWLIDRFWAPLVALLIFAAAATGLLIFVGAPPSLGIAALAVGLLGFCTGMEGDIGGFLVARYLGNRSYGVIYGTIYGAFGFGVGIAAFGYGVTFDRTGSYHAGLIFSACAFVLSALFFVALGRYRYPVQQPPR